VEAETKEPATARLCLRNPQKAPAVSSEGGGKEGIKPPYPREVVSRAVILKSQVAVEISAALFVYGDPI